MSKKCVLQFAAIACIPFVCQGQPRQTTVKGELRGGSGAVPASYQLTLEDPGRNQGRVAEVEWAMDGAFEFRGVPYGAYWLKVKNDYGETITEAFVIVSAATPEVSLRLPERRIERPTGTSVSVTQLQHPPSRKAVRAAQEAARLSAAAQPAKAAEKLREAIADSPEFAEAHTNLAAQMLRMREYPAGLEEARRAMEIAGPNPVDLTNAAFALAAMNQFDAAVTKAREALRIDGGYSRAHMVLGQILAMHAETVGEALMHLDRAAEEFPSAKAAADRIRGR